MAEQGRRIEEVVAEKEKALQQQIDEIKRDRDAWRGSFRTWVGILVSVIMGMLSMIVVIGLKLWTTPTATAPDRPSTGQAAPKHPAGTGR